MHIQSCLWSSTGANLFRGIGWWCIILPNTPNSRNTLQVLLAVKHPGWKSLETEQLHSHPADPGQIMCTRSCLALCPKLLPAPGCSWLLDGAVCAHTSCCKAAVLPASGNSPIPRVPFCATSQVPFPVWTVPGVWFDNGVFSINCSLLFRFTELTCHSSMM